MFTSVTGHAVEGARDPSYKVVITTVTANSKPYEKTHGYKCVYITPGDKSTKNTSRDRGPPCTYGDFPLKQVIFIGNFPVFFRYKTHDGSM